MRDKNGNQYGRQDDEPSQVFAGTQDGSFRIWIRHGLSGPGFEIEAERKRVEEKDASISAKEDAIGSRRRVMAKIFEKRHAPR